MAPKPHFPPQKAAPKARAKGWAWPKRAADVKTYPPPARIPWHTAHRSRGSAPHRRSLSPRGRALSARFRFSMSIPPLFPVLLPLYRLFFAEKVEKGALGKCRSVTLHPSFFCSVAYNRMLRDCLARERSWKNRSKRPSLLGRASDCQKTCSMEGNHLPCPSFIRKNRRPVRRFLHFSRGKCAPWPCTQTLAKLAKVAWATFAIRCSPFWGEPF